MKCSGEGSELGEDMGGRHDYDQNTLYEIPKELIKAVFMKKQY